MIQEKGLNVQYVHFIVEVILVGLGIRMFFFWVDQCQLSPEKLLHHTSLARRYGVTAESHVQEWTSKGSWFIDNNSIVNVYCVYFLQTRTTSLYRVKEEPIVPAPQPQTRPLAGLACARCAPQSRVSRLFFKMLWQIVPKIRILISTNE